METTYYLNKFQSCLDRMDKGPFDQQQLELKVGIWVHSVEGWIQVDMDNFDNEVTDLAFKFLEIQFIIDDLLEERKKP